MQRQNLAEIVALDEIADAYRTTVQVAGLSPQIVDICRGDSTSPDDLKRILVRTLQNTLPTSMPRSVRADGSALPASEFSIHEQKVQAAVIEAAHKSPVLRPVVTRDRTGREITEFFGEKRSWMNEFSKAPQLMKTCNGAPVRLPTIL